MFTGELITDLNEYELLAVWMSGNITARTFGLDDSLTTEGNDFMEYSGIHYYTTNGEPPKNVRTEYLYSSDNANWIDARNEACGKINCNPIRLDNVLQIRTTDDVNMLSWNTSLTASRQNPIALTWWYGYANSFLPLPK